MVDVGEDGGKHAAVGSSEAVGDGLVKRTDHGSPTTRPILSVLVFFSHHENCW